VFALIASNVQSEFDITHQSSSCGLKQDMVEVEYGAAFGLVIFAWLATGFAALSAVIYRRRSGSSTAVEG